MPRPRGVNTRIFSSRSRAVVLQAEWMVMTQRVATELKPLIKIAKEQNWTIESSGNGTKLIWTGPNGQGPVYTSYRCQGRDLMNYRAELVRAGLNLDEQSMKEHVNEVAIDQLIEQSEAASVDDVMAALNLVSTSVAIMCAKAEEFDRLKQQLVEWQAIAEDANLAGERAVKKLTEADATLVQIRECFSLAQWAILPEIAKLLGIDAHNPVTPRRSQ